MSLFDGIGLRVARDLAPEPQVPDWHLRVFEDRTHGVSVLYPASYRTVVDAADKLFSVASPYGIPRMDIGVTPDARADVAQLAVAYVGSLPAVIDKKRVYPRSSDEEVPEPVTSTGTTTLFGGIVADEISVDWWPAESKAELRTLVLSVANDARGRITLYLTGSPKHDWEDLRRLARTLRVDQ